MERQQEYAMTAYMNITNIIASEVGEPDDTDPT